MHFISKIYRDIVAEVKIQIAVKSTKINNTYLVNYNKTINIHVFYRNNSVHLS